MTENDRHGTRRVCITDDDRRMRMPRTTSSVPARSAWQSCYRRRHRSSPRPISCSSSRHSARTNRCPTIPPDAMPSSPRSRTTWRRKRATTAPHPTHREPDRAPRRASPDTQRSLSHLRARARARLAGPCHLRQLHGRAHLHRLPTWLTLNWRRRTPDCGMRAPRGAGILAPCFARERTLSSRGGLAPARQLRPCAAAQDAPPASPMPPALPAPVAGQFWRRPATLCRSMPAPNGARPIPFGPSRAALRARACPAACALACRSPSSPLCGARRRGRSARSGHTVTCAVPHPCAGAA